jgi:hypothetical protein
MWRFCQSIQLDPRILSYANHIGVPYRDREPVRLHQHRCDPADGAIRRAGPSAGCVPERVYATVLRFKSRLRTRRPGSQAPKGDVSCPAVVKPRTAWR